MNFPSSLIHVSLLAALCLASVRLSAQDIVYLDLFKRSWYEQKTADDPVLIPQANDPFDVVASAYLSSEILNDPDAIDFLKGMTFDTPNRETHGMDFNPFQPEDGFWFYEGSVTESYLRIHYGAGTYRFVLSSFITGDSLFTATLGADDYPPAPKVLNFAAAQTVDPAKDFTLNWTGFTGSGQREIWILVYDPATQSVYFDSGPLEGTATSIMIPAGTLELDKDYEVELQFTRFSRYSPGTVPEVYTGFEAFNHAPLKTRSGGGPLDPPVLGGYRRLDNGDLELTVTCTPNRTLKLHGTAALGGGWSVLQTTTPTSSPATVVVPRASLGSQQFIRASQE